VTDSNPASDPWLALAEERRDQIARAVESRDWIKAIGDAGALWALAARRNDARRPRAMVRDETPRITQEDLRAQDARLLFRSIVEEYLDVAEPGSAHTIYGDLVSKFIDADLVDEAGFALLDHASLPVFAPFDEAEFQGELGANPTEGSYAHRVKLWEQSARLFGRSGSAAAVSGTLKVARAAGRNLDSLAKNIVDSAAVPVVDRLMEQTVRWFETAVAQVAQERRAESGAPRHPNEVSMAELVDAFEQWAEFRERSGFSAMQVAGVYTQLKMRREAALAELSDERGAAELAARFDHFEDRADELWVRAKAEAPTLDEAAQQHPSTATPRRRSTRRSWGQQPKGGAGGIGF